MERIIKLGIYLTLLTPLILGRFGLTLSAYPKAVFFRSLMEIIFVFYLFLLLINYKKYAPKISLLSAAISIFILMLFSTSITGINFYRSFFGDPERAEGLILQVHLLVFFFVIVNIFDRREEWFKLFKISIIISGISSLAGIMQKLNMHHFYGVSLPQRISGTLSNPDFFAPYIVSAIFVTFFVLLAEKNKKLKNFWKIILILNFLTLIMSGTRGAWIGMIAGLIAMCPIYYLYYSKKEKRKRILFLSSILIVSILFFIMILYPEKFNLKGNYYYETFFSIFELDMGSRGDVWDLSYRAFKDRPVLGWGTESFSFVYDKYYSHNYLRYISENIYFDHPHNKLIEIIVSSGILGLISYLFIYLAAFYLIFKHNKSWEGYNKKSKNIFSWVLFGFFVSYFFQNLFFFDSICNFIIFYLVIGFINNNFCHVKDEKNLENNYFDKNFSFSKKMLAAGAVFLILIVLYVVNIKPTIVAMQFPRNVVYENSNIDKAYSGYLNAERKKTIYDMDFRLIMIERSIYLLENNKAAKIENKVVEELVYLTPLFKKDLEKNDRRQINSYEYLARIYQRIYLFSKDNNALVEMENVIDKALSFNNEVTTFYQLKGELEMLKNNFGEGEIWFDKMYELTPKTLKDKADYYRKKGVAYLKAGNESLGIKNLKKTLDVDYYSVKFSYQSALDDPISLTDTVAVMYYMDYNDFEKSLELYQRAIEIYPKYQKVLNNHLEMIKSEMLKKGL